jgi:hypothetical protein
LHGHRARVKVVRLLEYQFLQFLLRQVVEFHFDCERLLASGLYVCECVRACALTSSAGS